MKIHPIKGFLFTHFSVPPLLDLPLIKGYSYSSEFRQNMIFSESLHDQAKPCSRYLRTAHHPSAPAFSMASSPGKLSSQTCLGCAAFSGQDQDADRSNNHLNPHAFALRIDCHSLATTC